jgi:hypothetical protein
MRISQRGGIGLRQFDVLDGFDIEVMEQPSESEDRRISLRCPEVVADFFFDKGRFITYYLIDLSYTWPLHNEGALFSHEIV